jgi:hypothetical protein
VTESVAVDAVMPATFCPGVQTKIIGKFAGNRVSVVTAVGVPSLMRIWLAADATKSTERVWVPNAVEAALVVVSDTFCAAPSLAPPGIMAVMCYALLITAIK